MTIADLIRDRRLLWVYCRDCGRERDVDPATLPLPGGHPVPEVGKRMKCLACGSRKIDARPELYPGGIEAMRTRWGGKSAPKAVAHLRLFGLGLSGVRDVHTSSHQARAANEPPPSLPRTPGEP